MSKSRLVYSTESGRICPRCSDPVSFCKCKQKKEATNKSIAGLPEDGIIRISREIKGRKGKTVTVITGIPLDISELKKLTKKLKTICGSGGSIKEGAIVLQGDHRLAAMEEITKQGYRVKLAGG